MSVLSEEIPIPCWRFWPPRREIPVKTPQPQCQAAGKQLLVLGHPQPTSCYLHLASCTLHSVAFVLHSAAFILHPRPSILQLQPAPHTSQSTSYPVLTASPTCLWTVVTEEFILVPLAVAVIEDLPGSIHTTHHDPAMCIPTHMWDDLGALSFGRHVQLPVGHHEGQTMDLCTASWQLDFGWHVFYSLLCWDKGERRGREDDG